MKPARQHSKTIPIAAVMPYDRACRDCPRLSAFLDEVRSENPGYFCGPVPSFGPSDAPLLIVGLAPGMHGANRTGRPFTGDYAGILLYATLHKLGFASHAGSADPADGLELVGCRITNAVKCLPPQNKPDTAEIRQCNRYLRAEMQAMKPRAILALGRIAHDAVLHASDLKPRDHVFAHGAIHELPRGVRLYDSYHCSRYNTQTRRLTAAMFEDVLGRIASDLRQSPRA